MLYTPKSYKYLKQYKNNRKTSVVKTPVTGNFRYLIIATECGIITARQIEALRRFLTRRISTKVRLIRYVTLHKAFTCKGSKSRMGKGYGKLEG
jgi:large subunit ribosomal protein L16